MNIIFLILLYVPLSLWANTDKILLEEVIVTAQKREQSVQDIPISVAVINASDIERMSIHSLRDLNGLVPSLNIQQSGNAATTLAMAIRGHGPDPSQITREGSVGVYIDGIYMSRPQGMGVDLADPARIEILRGPQGTLFGRNTVGGAVSIISKKPTGQFNLKQTLTMGNYGSLRSVTRLNLPVFNRLSTKVDYIHDEFDGWVDNTANGENFTEYDNNGGRLSLHYDTNNKVSIDYTYDNTRTETTQYYFQLFKDFTPSSAIGDEPSRQQQSRYPIPLDPTIIKKNGHTLNASWEWSPSLTLQSITGYHELQQVTHNNYGGVLYVSGLIDAYTIDHYQRSQEIQLIGSSHHIDWIAGLYYFEEHATQDFNTQISLTPSFETMQPVTVDKFAGESRVTSNAVFGQITWSPPQMTCVQITLGGRYTHDKKVGQRTRNPNEHFRVGSHSTAPMIAITYNMIDDMSIYAKWSSAYKSVGYNLRSTSFQPYGTEKNTTSEVGFRSEWWRNKARVNVTAFTSDYNDMQLDFIDPNVITNPETKNAINTVSISGVEMDITVTPTASLSISASYVYLETDKTLQPNPLNTDLYQTFHVTQAPQHAGAITVDYRLSQKLSTHVNIISTDKYAHVSFEPLRLDAYTLVNAKMTLNLPFNKTNIDVSAWINNALDEEYVTNGFAVGSPAITITQVFGDPRTYGLDISYQF